MSKSLELMVVMPVFNEQASVRKVVLEWFHEVENWTEDFILLAINDGSTDGTAQILTRLREQLGPRFEILDQTNRGHGQSCLVGYRVPATSYAPPSCSASAPIASTPMPPTD